MSFIHIIVAVTAGLVLTCTSVFADEFSPQQPQYVCPPCPHVIDIFETKQYAHDGRCSICGMNLIELNHQDAVISQTLHLGSGNFDFETVKGINISVFYYKPKQFGPDTKILLVVPGAGRGAWEYRDNWVAAAEKYNVLIVSPSYSEQDYDYAAYNLSGILSSVKFTNFTTAQIEGRVHKYFVQDRDILKGDATKPATWIFQDFERLFDKTVKATHSSQQKYDIFGHSAGGQILSRMALYQPRSKANRIIAANSGSYTLPSFEYDFPIGLGASNFNETSLNQSFSAQLTILVGEQDNDGETRGTLLHTPTLDKQGLGRLSRGKYFYEAAQTQANRLNTEFKWQLHLVEGIGHESKEMGQVAAKLLYEQDQRIPKVTL